MQNFGRGMWRRVGDYDRIQKPIIIQQSRLEQLQKLVQYQNFLNQQKNRNSIKSAKLEPNNITTSYKPFETFQIIEDVIEEPI